METPRKEEYNIKEEGKERQMVFSDFSIFTSA